MDASRILLQARARSGLSLRQLAARAHTSHSTLAAYESGRKIPTAATLTRIVKAAGFALDATLAPRIRCHGEISRSDELLAVLELAASFPARHSPTLGYPIFGST